MLGKTLISLGLILSFLVVRAQDRPSGSIKGTEYDEPIIKPLHPWSSDPEKNQFPGYGYFRIQRVYADLPPGKIWLNTNNPLWEKIPRDPLLQPRNSKTYSNFWPRFGKVAGTLANTFITTPAGTDWLR